MKKYLLIGIATLSTLILISWGGIGHKTVATIAENHLTVNAKSAIKALLGDQSIAEVASWADNVRNQPEYKETGPWHYVDLELGLPYDKFASEVKAQGGNNVYGALLKCENDLKSTSTTKEQKADALKFIIHFVGDAHQPMHVSRAADKGGNTIQVQFDGKGTNLHSLWDSGLISHEGKTFDQMAKDYDTATPAEIKKWQSDSPMQWLWESYQISTKIYADADKGNKLDDAYYKANIPVVQQRIEMGGIRLAGVLNELFKNGYSGSAATVAGVTAIKTSDKGDDTPVIIAIKDAAANIGKSATIESKVYSSRDMGSMVLVNLGAEYPNQLLTVVLRGNAKVLGKDLEGKTVLVTGKLEDYKGKPEIVVNDIVNFKIVPMVGHGGTRGGE